MVETTLWRIGVPHWYLPTWAWYYRVWNLICNSVMYRFVKLQQNRMQKQCSKCVDVAWVGEWVEASFVFLLICRRCAEWRWASGWISGDLHVYCHYHANCIGSYCTKNVFPAKECRNILNKCMLSMARQFRMNVFISTSLSSSLILRAVNIVFMF